MIQTKDLRVGNLVINLYGNEYIVGWINEGIIKQVSPIPLTEEWILKLGFEKEDLGNTIFYYTLGPINFSIHHNTDIDMTLYSGYEITHIKYVHQLQNLFYCLTGEELTINQPTP